MTAALPSHGPTAMKMKSRKRKNEPRKPLSPAAERALAEAAQRRAEIDRKAAERPKESGGPKGPEPTRYGDWEKKGLASDF